MAKRGRYGIVSGCLWRNRKAMEGVTRAALGHLTCIWSFVADNQTGGVITVSELRALGRGNPNASRWVKELVSVRFLEAHPEGFLVHDYRDWNRLPESDADMDADRLAYRDANKGADRDANEDADKASSMITEWYAPVPRAHETQDPRPKTQIEREARSPSAAACQEVSEAYRALCFDRGWDPVTLRGAGLTAAVERAQLVAARHGCDLATATRRLMAAAHERSAKSGQGVGLALRDCEVPVPVAVLPDPFASVRGGVTNG